MSCIGYCRNCKTEHSLPAGMAKKRAQLLFQELEEKQNIGLFSKNLDLDPELSTKPLFSEERGKMFGVLECLNQNKEKVWLYAFSGQFNGNWCVENWVPPLFDLEVFKKTHDHVERKIKALGQELEKQGVEHRRKFIQNERKQLSRKLMHDIHTIYKLNNFLGKTATLHQAFDQPGGKPTGTGDCCAPKLLNFAASRSFAPLSLAEFFFGRENRSKSREHGYFYPHCSDKCGPILGFMLCGAEQRRKKLGR